MKLLSMRRGLIRRIGALTWKRGGGRPVCRYCLGKFRPKKSWGIYCCNACRKAAWHAVHAEELDPVSLRKETWSGDRAAATGFGSMTRRQTFKRDLFIRRKAGIEHW